MKDELGDVRGSRTGGSRLAVSCLLLVCCTACSKAPPPPTLSGGKPIEFRLDSIHSPDPHVRKEAVFKLGNVGPADPGVVPALIAALDDVDSTVRTEAIIALAKTGDGAKTAQAKLADLKSRDPDPRVRDAATKALARLSTMP